MSCRNISIVTAQGNELRLLAARNVSNATPYSNLGWLIATGKASRVPGSDEFPKDHFYKKTVTVQYGIGVAGEGKTLKEAVENFRENWTFFCNNREAIVRGEIPGWN